MIMMIRMMNIVITPGCPTDSSIMQSLLTVGSAKILQANFDAFKFPTSQLVQFRALVTPCMPRCAPVRCQDSGTAFSSFGRRKRDAGEDDHTPERVGTATTGESVVVANAVHIVDTFHMEGEPSHTHTVEGSCLYEGVAVCVVLSVFLVCQCVLLLLCVRHTARARTKDGHSEWQLDSQTRVN